MEPQSRTASGKSLYEASASFFDAEDREAFENARSIGELNTMRLNSLVYLPCSRLIEKSGNAIGFVSQSGQETVYFSKPVSDASLGAGNAKGFLESVMNEIKNTMKAQMKACLNDAKTYSIPVIASQKKYAKCVILTVLLVHLTKKFDKAVNENKVEDLIGDLVEETIQLQQVSNKFFRDLVLQYVHAQGVAEEVLQEGPIIWEEQVKHQVDSDGSISICHDGNSIKYDYCYDDNSRLIRTKIFDEVFRIFVDSKNHMMYATGPAGTGKTESYKDIMGYCGKALFVINSSDQIEVKDFDKSSSQTALDGGISMCFDEANRMKTNVVEYWCKKIQRNFGDSYILFTLNPGYAGRTALPTPNKLLLTQNMTVPPSEEIVSGHLAIAGAKHFKQLGAQMMQAVTVMRATLRPTDWYDFGLRSLMQVVNTSYSFFKTYPDMDQDLLVAVAMKLSLADRCRESERGPAIDIINSAFFGGKNTMKKKITNFTTLNNKGLIGSDFETIFEMAQWRHALGLVVPNDSDLPQIAEDFANDAQNGQDANVFQMKCIDNGALMYGELKGDKKWNDGFFTTVFRKACDAAAADPVKKNYLVMYGLPTVTPNFAIITENLNTLFDMNKKLCLANGEIVTMPPNLTVVNLLYTENVKFASPAFVSRLGMTTLRV